MRHLYLSLALSMTIAATALAQSDRDARQDARNDDPQLTDRTEVPETRKVKPEASMKRASHFANSNSATSGR